MKKDLLLWQLGGLTFSAILGTILHFLYDWTGWILIAPFSAVNESTWEHMKLLFFPAMIFAIIQSFYFKKFYPEFWSVKLVGILTGLIAIPVIFYTYNGAIGKSPDWFNILIFFIALFMEYFIEYLLFKYGKAPKKPKFLPFLGLGIIAISFIGFTFFAPNLPIFISPV